MTIVNMNELSGDQLRQAAQILTDSLPIGWPALSDAEEEIRERLIPENTLLAAIKDSEVLGWAGILPQYSGHVFELHPLAVRADMRHKGIGRALVEALEQAAVSRGGLTMWLGSDDEAPGGQTSLANVNLYDDLPRRMREFDPGLHPCAFYQKLGYTITGVMPDANGIGKPDIFMSKPLRRA